MPSGAIRLVLQACKDVHGVSDGFILDAEIARQTGLHVAEVRDCIEALDGRGFVGLARLNDSLKAQITPEGRLFLSQRRRFPEETKGEEAEPTRIKVVPKGLRSFDEHDADFFLDLLPGPRRSDGLTESVHFWKVRIEQVETTFRLGVIYGPSGCGKSSFVKAGVLPKLSDLIRHIYVEATGDRTESECLTGIHRRCPALAPTVGLVDSLAALGTKTTSHSGEKMLLVLDQFEQWLLEHRGEADTELVRALRHCDGKCLVAILMVREDFLAATIQFMKEIGVEFRPDHNACEVELFSPRHAEKVLRAFGRAEGIFRDEPTTEHERFIKQSVKALARNGGFVIPVRLAIFFQTVKNQEWNSKTLRKFGDAEGVGVAFLEKTFNDEYADRRHRDHQEAAQLVLAALLPESDREIKRPSRTRRELLDLSGYSSRPDRFDDLIRILDEELRLITAIDQDEVLASGSPRPTSGERFFQLTHDFLVPSLREWRSHKDREASQLVETIWMAETRDVPRLINRLATLRFWANPLLHRILETSGVDSKERLHASLALLPVDDGQVEYLYQRLLKTDPPELSVLREALSPYREVLVERLWGVLEQSGTVEERQQLRAASALALYDPSNPRWQTVGDKLAQAIVTVNAIHLGFWLDALRSAREKLTAPLAAIFRDRGRPAPERNLASNLLEDYATDQPHILLNLLIESNEDHFNLWFKKLANHPKVAISLLNKELSIPLPEAVEVENDVWTQRKARAAVALVRLGRMESVWPLLRHSPDPSLRSYLVNWLKPLGADPQALLSGLECLKSSAGTKSMMGRQAMEDILFDPETSERIALILALGVYDPEEFSHNYCVVIDDLIELYRNDPNAGIHGAAEWTLRRWRLEDKLAAIDEELKKLKDQGDRRWYVNGEGQTFVVIDGPVEFMMGSPVIDPDRDLDETWHRLRINRRYAIATKEVTVEQYQRFLEDSPKIARLDIDRHSPEPTGPMNGMTWFEAAAYCNWLSQQEGLEACYKSNRNGEYAAGMRIIPTALTRHGYRLPTEAEWEYACRAGAITRRYYGQSAELLGKYAWYSQNSQDRAWPCGQLLPNELGMFDMLGNVYEWCQDQYSNYTESVNNTRSDKHNTVLTLREKDARLLRGGSFKDPPAIVRSAYRDRLQPSYRYSIYGFRPSRTYP